MKQWSKYFPTDETSFHVMTEMVLIQKCGQKKCSGAASIWRE